MQMTRMTEMKWTGIYTFIEYQKSEIDQFHESMGQGISQHGMG
jgi:hypothetical protein